MTNSGHNAPIEWYVAHILSCLVAPARRLKVSELPDALAAMRQLAGECLPETAFAQRAQAEAIRLGIASEGAI
jgi:hypothetical protein